LASNQVFERGIAVETAAVLADLADPGPDILWRRVDSNGMGDGSLRAEEEFISREGGGQFGAGGDPTNVPRPKGGKVDDVENDNEAQRRKTTHAEISLS